MAMNKKNKIDNLVLNSFNKSSRHTFLASPQLSQKKETNVSVSSEKDIENLIFTLSEGDRNVVLKKLLHEIGLGLNIPLYHKI